MHKNARSWLLVPERSNSVLENIARSVVTSTDGADLTDRVSVALGMIGDKSVLWTDKPDKLFEKLELPHKKKSLLAFSLAPASALRRLDGRVFLHKARWIEVRTRISDRDHDVGAREAPYFRRLVELRWIDSQNAETLQNTFDDLEVGERNPAVPALLLKPVDVECAFGAFAMMFGQNASALSELPDGALLPPVRTPPADSYFSERCRQLRQALAHAAGIERPSPDEAAAITVWRMGDDPLIRDLLLEGGGLVLTGERGMPTGVRLDVHGLAGGDQIAAYRALSVLEPDRLEPGRVPGPSLSRRVARVVQDDIRHDLIAGLGIGASTDPVSWTVPPLSETRQGGEGRAEGSWKRLQAIKERLDGGKERSWFDDEITVPSRGRLTGDPNRPLSNPNHDLAELRFIAVAWRGTSPPAQSAAWRYAMVTLLGEGDELSGIRVSPDRRVQRFRDEWGGGGFEFRAPEMVHSARATPEQLLYWRLLMPLGTIFTPRSPLRLDDAISRIDEGYALG